MKKRSFGSAFLLLNHSYISSDRAGKSFFIRFRTAVFSRTVSRFRASKGRFSAGKAPDSAHFRAKIAQNPPSRLSKGKVQKI
jgi:hypothetical protein